MTDKKEFYNISKVFIVSPGRTGTKFFGNNLKALSKCIYSVHEPDKISLARAKRKESIEKIRQQGIKRPVILKLLGYSGTRNLSLQNLKNSAEKKNIINRFIEDRKWIDLNNTSCYIEANSQLFGLIRQLKSMPNSRLIIIFRDPRSWIKSWVNKGEWYTKDDLLSIINLGGLKRLSPENVGIYNEHWKEYSRFQKLCWVWNFMTNLFISEIEKASPNLAYFFFEDLFIKRDVNEIERFLRFSLNDLYDPIFTHRLRKMLDHKVNENRSEIIPSWEHWDYEMCKNLDFFCGDLMDDLGYGKEQEWLEKLWID